MKNLARLGLASLLLSLVACGSAADGPTLHEGDEIRWEEPGTAGSEEPVQHSAKVTGWDGTWIECDNGKRLEASTFDSLAVTCPHE